MSNDLNFTKALACFQHQFWLTHISVVILHACLLCIVEPHWGYFNAYLPSAHATSFIVPHYLYFERAVFFVFMTKNTFWLSQKKSQRFFQWDRQILTFCHVSTPIYVLKNIVVQRSLCLYIVYLYGVESLPHLWASLPTCLVWDMGCSWTILC